MKYGTYVLGAVLVFVSMQQHANDPVWSYIMLIVGTVLLSVATIAGVLDDE